MTAIMDKSLTDSRAYKGYAFPAEFKGLSAWMKDCGPYEFFRNFKTGIVLGVRRTADARGPLGAGMLIAAHCKIDEPESMVSRRFRAWSAKWETRAKTDRFMKSLRAVQAEVAE